MVVEVQLIGWKVKIFAPLQSMKLERTSNSEKEGGVAAGVATSEVGTWDDHRVIPPTNACGAGEASTVIHTQPKDASGVSPSIIQNPTETGGISGVGSDANLIVNQLKEIGEIRDLKSLSDIDGTWKHQLLGYTEKPVKETEEDNGKDSGPRVLTETARDDCNVSASANKDRIATIDEETSEDDKTRAFPTARKNLATTWDAVETIQAEQSNNLLSRTGQRNQAIFEASRTSQLVDSPSTKIKCLERKVSETCLCSGVVDMVGKWDDHRVISPTTPTSPRARSLPSNRGLRPQILHTPVVVRQQGVSRDASAADKDLSQRLIDASEGIMENSHPPMANILTPIRNGNPQSEEEKDESILHLDNTVRYEVYVSTPNQRNEGSPNPEDVQAAVTASGGTTSPGSTPSLRLSNGNISKIQEAVASEANDEDEDEANQVNQGRAENNEEEGSLPHVMAPSFKSAASLPAHEDINNSARSFRDHLVAINPDASQEDSRRAFLIVLKYRARRRAESMLIEKPESTLNELVQGLKEMLERTSQVQRNKTHPRPSKQLPGESSDDPLFHRTIKLATQSYHEYQKNTEYQKEDVTLEKFLEGLNQSVKSLAIREARPITDQTRNTTLEGEARLAPNEQPLEPTQLPAQSEASLANTATDHGDRDDCRDYRSERQGRDEDYRGRSSEIDSQVSRREIFLTFTGKCHYCGKVGHMARSHNLKQRSVANQQKSKDPASNHQTIQVDAEEEASCLREMILWQDLRIHELKEWNDRLRRDNSSSTSRDQTSQADPPSAMALWTIFGQKNKFPRSKFNWV
ncbi:hypothetical protein CRE_23886 [Caenorhabditis remanei]|uniref:Uncharacterized protein n=1 Tax=Caenorhabditis remanei TaxID=31234 RepID=E3MG98_CAERE|nr:hypothetical protein CRE_23886 [Caenorhabditis remanei]